MTESEFTQENVAYIRTRLDNIERMVRLDIASNPDNKAHVEQVLKGRRNSAQFYLALADGPKSEAEAAEVVRKSVPTACRVLNYLYETGLIGKMPNPDGDSIKVFCWTDIERTLGVSCIARTISGE